MSTYYIRTTGSNSNNGTTPELAKLTLDSALSIAALTGGDIIDVGAGTFTGVSNTDFPGSLGNPITIRGAGMGVTTFTGTLTIDQGYYTVEDATWEKSGISISGATNVTLTRVEAWGIDSPISVVGLAANGIIDSCVIHHPNGRNGALAGDGDNWLVTNCTFRDSNGHDFMRLNNVSNWTFKGNTFIRNRSPGSYTNSSSSTNTVSIGTKVFTVDTDTAYVLQDRLRFTNGANYIEGYVTGIAGLDITIDCMKVSGSGTFSSWSVGTNDPTDHADTVQAFSDPVSNYHSYNVIFEQNLWQDCTAEIGQVTEGDGDIRDWTFRNNVFWNSRTQINVYAPGFKFYNNTVYNNDNDTGFSGQSDPLPSRGNGIPIEVWNNIFCRSGVINSGGAWNGSVVNTNADYNFTSNYGTDAAKDATKYGTTHGINTGTYTPYDLFVDPDNGDFHLKAGSPVISAGKDLSAEGFSNDYTGATRSGTWSMGAYAYTTTGIPTISSATIPSGGTTVSIVWSEACTTGAGGAGGFTLTTSSGSITLTYVSGSGSTTYVYSIPSTVLSTEMISSLAYVQPGNGIEATTGGGDVGTFTEFMVNNNSTQVVTAIVSNRRKHRLNPGTHGAFL